MANEPQNYTRYAREALETLEAYKNILGNTSQNEINWIRLELIAGELERRLGMFVDAQRRFEKLRQIETAKPFYKRIIELQLQLMSSKDSQKHMAPN